jgi:hypothetical protein
MKELTVYNLKKVKHVIFDKIYDDESNIKMGLSRWILKIRLWFFVSDAIMRKFYETVNR